MDLGLGEGRAEVGFELPPGWLGERRVSAPLTGLAAEAGLGERSIGRAGREQLLRPPHICHHASTRRLAGAVGQNEGLMGLVDSDAVDLVHHPDDARDRVAVEFAEGEVIDAAHEDGRLTGWWFGQDLIGVCSDHSDAEWIEHGPVEVKVPVGECLVRGHQPYGALRDRVPSDSEGGDKGLALAGSHLDELAVAHRIGRGELGPTHQLAPGGVEDLADDCGVERCRVAGHQHPGAIGRVLGQVPSRHHLLLGVPPDLLDVGRIRVAGDRALAGDRMLADGGTGSVGGVGLVRAGTASARSGRFRVRDQSLALDHSRGANRTPLDRRGVGAVGGGVDSLGDGRPLRAGGLGRPDGRAGRFAWRIDLLPDVDGRRLVRSCGELRPGSDR